LIIPDTTTPKTFWIGAPLAGAGQKVLGLQKAQPGPARTNKEKKGLRQ